MNPNKEFVGITEAKNRLPQVVNSLDRGEVDHVFVMRNNKPAAVLVPSETYEEMRELKGMREHLEDAILVLSAQEADSGERYTLDDVLAEAESNPS